MSEEKKVLEQYKEGPEAFKTSRTEIATLKYYWQISPLSGLKSKNIPRFLRKIEVFKNFNDSELKTLSRFMHERVYNAGEQVFEEGDSGFGFYLIYSGGIELFSKNPATNENELITSYGEYDYFGELALLERRNRRNASAICSSSSTLLTLYTPDLEELIEKHPIVGARFIQAVGFVISQRFIKLSEDFKLLHNKVCNEQPSEENEN